MYFLTYLKASKTPTQTADRNKFSPLSSPYAPFSIPAWSAALQAVDQSPSRLIETSKSSAHYGHYTFPDPGLFTSPATAAKYIESWLRIREVWFMRVEKEPSLAMSNQTWRTFLAMDTNALERGNTKAAQRRQQCLSLLMPNSKMYPEVTIRSGSMGPIVWQGQKYTPGELPPEHIVREILWELYEVNFIHELQSLDRRACADLDLLNTGQLLERQNDIARCFPTASFRHVAIPPENVGLAADNFSRRFEFVIALILVMKSWRGDKPVTFQASVENLHNLSGQGMQHLETEVAKYYCQQFFNYFGRAAQIPHRLFCNDR